MNHELRDFESQVVQRSKEVPVLVDFWAPWCGPCQTLGPVLERMACKANGRWELVKVNTEEHQDLAAGFNIASIPAVKLFVDGEVKDEFVGALPERQIRQFLDKALPSPGAPQLAEANRLLSQGQTDSAEKLLENVLDSEPTNAEARMLLAQCLLRTGPERIPSLLENVAQDSEFFEKANALRTLARLAHAANHPTSFPEGNAREKYLAGAAAVRSGDFAAALEAFTQVLERNKQYDNGGAKDACKAIFQLLGMRHPVVEGGFRAFSSALHS